MNSAQSEYSGRHPALRIDRAAQHAAGVERQGKRAVAADERAVNQAMQQLEDRVAELDVFAERRAQTLLADHRRVREAAGARGGYSVKALLPADVIGLFVLLPRVD